MTSPRSILSGAAPRRRFTSVLEASARAVAWQPLTLGCGLGVGAAALTPWLSPQSRSIVAVWAFLLIGASAAFVIGEQAAAIAAVAPCPKKVRFAARSLLACAVCGTSAILATVFAHQSDAVVPGSDLALIAATAGVTALAVAVVAERTLPQVDPAVASFGALLQFSVAAMITADQPWARQLLTVALWNSSARRTSCVLALSAVAMWWATAEPRRRRRAVPPATGWLARRS